MAGRLRAENRAGGQRRLGAGLRHQPHSVFPWHSGIAPEASFDRTRLDDPVSAARALLGARLVSDEGRRTVGVIVETEAYGDASDPASHAATASGITERNRVMFGPAGFAYVYRSYGTHWCFNVVTGAEGRAGAVLVRGIEPLEGEATMMERRGRTPLGAGPGRLCQALGISDVHYGHDLCSPPLQLLGGWRVADELVGQGPRIGISKAADWPHRFYVRASSGVTPGTPDD